MAIDDPDHKPATRQVKVKPEDLLVSRLNALERLADHVRFLEDVYLPQVIKDQKSMGEITGRVNEISSSIGRIDDKASNAASLVSDFDTRMQLQIERWNNQLNGIVEDQTVIKSAFKDIKDFITGQQELIEDRKIILNRSQQVGRLLVRVLVMALAGAGGLSVFMELLKLWLGVK